MKKKQATKVVKDKAQAVDAERINLVLAGSEGPKNKKRKKVDKLDALIVKEQKGAVEAVRNSLKGVINIHNQGGEVGGRAVFVAVNGLGYQIPREKMIKVPMPIIQALENAVESQYFREEKDGLPFGPIIERKVPRYAMTVFQRDIE